MNILVRKLKELRLCKCNGDLHDKRLNMKVLRFHLSHTIGEHPPNDNAELLCNGHCSWSRCSPFTKCKKCGYLQCYGCGDEFYYSLSGIFCWFDDDGWDYCRGCGRHNTNEEVVYEKGIRIK